ncbi:hypothetical protein ACFX2B_043391 [Malus domestica]
MAIFDNSEPKIAISSGGYVLKDVPHLVNYIPDLPTYPNPLQDNSSYSVVKQYFVNADDTVAQKVPEPAIDTTARTESTEVGSMPMALQMGFAGSSGGGAGYKGRGVGKGLSMLLGLNLEQGGFLGQDNGFRAELWKL